MDLSRREFVASMSTLPVMPSLSPAKMLIIDAHVHAGHGTGITHESSTFLDPELTLARMADGGIDRSIIFPCDNYEYEKPNQEIAEYCHRYAPKFIGYAKHDPVTEKGRIAAMLKHEVNELGLRGLKLHVHPNREILDAVAELGVPIIYHPPKTVADFHMIARTYPQVNFIIAQLGNWSSADPWEHVAAIDIARRYPNVYTEASGVQARTYLEMAAKEIPDKLMFGSDGPETDCRVELYKIRSLKLPPQQEAQVLGGNMMRILPKGTL